MRIKIIGENNCARATRHLLRLAGFAVTDFLPADAVVQGPAAGYAITIDHFSDLSPAAVSPNSLLGPEPATQQQMSSASLPAVAENQVAAGLPSFSSAFAENPAAADLSAFSPAGTSEVSAIGKPFLVENSRVETSGAREGTGTPADSIASANPHGESMTQAGKPAVAGFSAKAGRGGLAGYIHFDSVDSALEAAVLRHVAQLAAGPVIVDRPGGVVRSERELRIVAPCSGDARADEAAAVAIEFGVLRGLLDLVAPDARGEMRWNGAGKKLLSADGEGAAERREENLRASLSRSRKKLWWPFAAVLLGAALGAWSAARGNVAEASGLSRTGFSLSAFDFLPRQQESLAEGLGDFSAEGHRLKPGPRRPVTLASNVVVEGLMESRRLPFVPQAKKPVLVDAALLTPAVVETVGKGDRLKPVLLAAAAQGQFATGSGVKITDGVNFLVVDPCQGQVKLYASINQTSNTQLVAGTVSRKIYVCSIHVVAAAATDVAVVEGTGSVCATGTAGVSGFGGATAATGWNFAANGGIALGSGDSSLELRERAATICAFLIRAQARSPAGSAMWWSNLCDMSSAPGLSFRAKRGISPSLLRAQAKPKRDSSLRSE